MRFSGAAENGDVARVNRHFGVGRWGRGPLCGLIGCLAQEVLNFFTETGEINRLGQAIIKARITIALDLFA